MTVFIQTARVRYTCDGVATTFIVFWPFVDSTHVQVVRRASGSDVEQVLTPNVDYTIVPPTGPWPSGAFFNIPLGTKNAAGDTIAISRAEPIKQSADYQENDSFPAATHEAALDYLATLASRANERLDRALSIRVSDPLGGATAKYDALNARIINVADPVAGTDAATRDWVLSQISAPVGWAPDKNLAQWNADRLQGRAIATTAPTDGYVLKWSATNGRWEPAVSNDATSLLASNNTWTGQNVYNGQVQVNNDLQMTLPASNLNFTSSAQRIKGRFYGAVHSDRTLFTPNAAGQSCIIGVVPTLAGGDAGIGYYGNNDPDNASVLYIAAGPASTLIQASHTGVGVTQPLQIAMDATVAMKVLTDSKVLVNNTVNVTGCQFQVTGMASRETAFVSVHRNGVAFGVPNAAFTKIDFTTEDFDNKGWFDIALDRFTPTVPGIYQVCASGGPDAVVVAGIRAHVSVFKNGAIHKTMSDLQGGGAAAMTSAGSCYVFLNGAGDFIELFAWQNSGGVQSWGGNSQDCYFQIAHVG